jgi:hypothetical protein
MTHPRQPRTARSSGPTQLPVGARDVVVPIDVAVAEIRAGRMIVLVDDEDRENEGDLCMAAEKVTPEAINFMARFGRGLICLPLGEEQIDRLRLGMMVPDAENSSGFRTSAAIGARVSASSPRSTAASTPGSKSAARSARCSSTWAAGSLRARHPETCLDYPLA